MFKFYLMQTVLAHGTVVEHEEEAVSDVATLDPAIIIGVLGVVVIAGFFVWRFLFRKKQ